MSEKLLVWWKILEAKDIAGYIFAISLGIYFFAYVGIPALAELFSANITALPTAVGTLVTTVVGIAVAAGAIIYFLPAGIKSRVGL